MKHWNVITYDDQRRRKQGHLVSPKVFEAETRREAKTKFIKRYPAWVICQLIASPVKE